ncbi:hypothetical protein V6N13_031252 [Hibiscus sabdariffa]
MHSALFHPNSSGSGSHGFGPGYRLRSWLWGWHRTGISGSSRIRMLMELVYDLEKKTGSLVIMAFVGFNKVNNATVKYDRTTVSYDSYAGDSWIGYDNVKSIKWKVWFARVKGLVGYFFWAVTYDKNWALSRQAMGVAGT